MDSSEAIAEVAAWAAGLGGSDVVAILTKNGYDDLSAIALCNDQEAKELVGCFSNAAHIAAVATKLEDLRRMGIDVYRRTVLQARVQNNNRRPSSLRFSLPTSKQTAPAPDRRLSMLKVAGIEGYLCVKSSGNPVWCDRYIVLDNEQMKWMTSRKEGEIDYAINIGRFMCNVQKLDGNTIKIQLLKGYLMLWSASSGEIEVWLGGLHRARQFWINTHPNEVIAESDVADERDIGKSVTLRARIDQDAKLTSDLQELGAALERLSEEKEALTKDTSAEAKAKLAVVEQQLQVTRQRLQDRRAADGQATLQEQLKTAKLQQKKSKTTSTSQGELKTSDLVAAAPEDVLFSSDEDTDDDEPNGEADPLSPWEAAVINDARERLYAKIAASLPVGATNLLSAVAEAEAAVAPATTHDMQAKLTLMKGMLIDGVIVKKYKKGTSNRRCIWLSRGFDYLIWGSPDKENVKGYMATDDINEVNQGYGMKMQNRLYIVSATRTLEIETKTFEQAKTFKVAFEVLIQMRQAEKEKRAAVEATEEFKTMFAQALEEHSKLLVEGERVRKWPGRKKLQKGGFTIRRLWVRASETNPNTGRELCWGDVKTAKVKGKLLLEELVDVWAQDDNVGEGKQNDSDGQEDKFALFSKGRTLDVEVVSAFVRKKWAAAFRFFVMHKNISVRIEVPQQAPVEAAVQDAPQEDTKEEQNE